MDKPPIIPLLTRAELNDLARAKALLENPGFAMRLANKLGGPIEKGFTLLPKGWSSTVNRAAKSAMLKALNVAVSTLNNRGPRKSREFFHKVLVGTSGGIGGAFGLAALPVELPVSTTIMLRSIADIARSEGHDLKLMTTKLACLEVFALGGTTRADDAAESAYWLTRAALSKSISEAASYLAEKGAVDATAPVVIRLINSIASRFGIIVSEEVAAKALPIVGAAGGSVVNVLFINHFQDMARGHFIVLRLEDKYGSEMVRDAYAGLALQIPPRLALPDRK
ncbi:MAG: hypothetical protein JWR19_2642 [Pedosphaera sp.]|nr:hypothetical protein [Pedosphaera sp.]